MIQTPLFQDLWSKSKTSIFRLESLPVYNVPEDLKIFEVWKRTKNFPAKSYQDWLQQLEKTKARGIVMQRIRIAPLPLSDYLKYEIAFWKTHSIKHGEQISFIDAEIYQKIKVSAGFEPKDFWMFDDKTVIIFHYDKGGDFLREEKVKDSALVRKHLELKKNLLDNSVELTYFLRDLEKIN